MTMAQRQLAVLDTRRLRLRTRTLDDLGANLAMDLDPQVYRYIFAQAPEPAHWRARLAGRSRPAGRRSAASGRSSGGTGRAFSAGAGWCPWGTPA
jgi:hypothetical protein